MEHAVAVRRRYGDMIDHEILDLIVMYLIRGMVSVESVMVVFSVCKCINDRKKEILPGIVKKLMPEVPRDRWGLMDNRTGREFVILYRNFKHGDRHDPGTFVKPGVHLARQKVFFQKHSCTLLEFSSNPHNNSPESVILSRRIHRALQEVIDDSILNRVKEDGPISLGLARMFGVFSSVSARKSFASVLLECKTRYENMRSADVMAVGGEPAHRLSILLVDCVLELVEKSFAIGRIGRFVNGYDEGYYIMMKPVFGIQLDVSADDVARVNARLPSSKQICMQMDDESLERQDVDDSEDDDENEDNEESEDEAFVPRPG
jgi:hypothetical protein